MVAQIQSRTGFTGFSKIINSPSIPTPLATNAMIVVMIGGMNTLSSDNTVFKSPASLGTNQPASLVQDNMGNSYFRVNAVNNNSYLMNMLLYEEIWVATVNFPVLKTLVVTVTYPSTTLCAGEVIVATPQNSLNQLAVDNTVLTTDNITNIFGSIGQASIFNQSELITPSLGTELVIIGMNYVFNNQPPTSVPTAPSINGVLGTNLLDNNSIVQAITSPSTGGVANTYGFGMSILTQNINAATNMNWTISSQGVSVVSWITLVVAIQEVTTTVLGVQEPIVSSSVSPESVALVATPIPGLNVIKFPLGS